jgi:hypothetical protein
VKLSKCINGHYYDNTKDKVCPYCQEQNDANVCTSSNEIKMVEEEKKSDNGKEVVLEEKVLEFDPVTGWLVCIEGPDRGERPIK